VYDLRFLFIVQIIFEFRIGKAITKCANYKESLEPNNSTNQTELDNILSVFETIDCPSGLQVYSRKPDGLNLSCLGCIGSV